MPESADSECTPPDNPEPRIIPRSKHPISRKNIDREALKVLYRLRDAGHTAYLVGGGVRDLYLGKRPKDFDISTDARPGQLRKIFRNSRLIGRRFRLVQVFFHGNKIIEVSTFRCRSEHDINGTAGKSEVLAANNTFGSPAEDAFRRDLTINGLFYEIENFTIIDYTGGVEDLDQRIIRVIGDPDRRFTRDPARMMRVIRHAARNDFRVEEKTWEAIRTHHEKLALCPVSRIRDELFKDLRGGASRAWAELAIESRIFSVLLPCYDKVLGEEKVRGQLLAILNLVDKLHGQEAVIPEQLLLALLLFPWAEAEMGLTASTLKGPQAHQFARQIRTSLDEALEHLSVRKSLKEAITLLFANLAHFERQEQDQGHRWPKWLSKKSYFKECKTLFNFLRQARGGRPLDPQTIAALKSPPPPPPRKAARKKGRGGKRGPAFSRKGGGGIFGFKKS